MVSKNLLIIGLIMVALVVASGSVTQLAIAKQSTNKICDKLFKFRAKGGDKFAKQRSKIFEKHPDLDCD
jgi:hypothetical protein